MKGTLVITADGHPVTIASALYVPAGTSSFRVAFSSVKRDCAWAKGGGIDFLERGEVLGSLDVAPVLDAAGVSRWRVVGAGWTSDSRAEHETSGNVGNVGWAADVTAGAGCERHIAIASDEDKHLHVHGDFDVICCGGPAPPSPPPPMVVKVGDATFPLTVAWTRAEKDASWHVRLSRGLPACSDEVTGADLVVDIRGDRDGATTDLRAAGQVLPPFGYVARSGSFPAIARSADAVDVNGVFRATPQASTDARALAFEIHGRAPLTTCAPAPR